MKLEIDIDEDYYKIICKRVKDNKPYHSPYEYEVIAGGKPLEQEPFINKPCVFSEVCEHDKRKVLDKIRAEIIELDNKVCQQFLIEDVDKEVHRAYQNCLDIIDKYKAEKEST